MISEYHPPIAIPAPDYSPLDRLARTAARDKHPVANFLLSELRRANIRAEAELPPNTVRLNHWVTYRLDWGWPSESRMLVHPQDYRSPAAHLSVLSPLGAALLGLSGGARMPFVTPEGVLHVVTAESLEPPMGVLSLLRSSHTKRAPQGEAASRDPFDSDDPGPDAASLEDIMIEVTTVATSETAPDKAKAHVLPPIMLLAHDVERLRRLADAASSKFPRTADFLAREVERASILDVDSGPSNLVTMGSTVEFRDDTDRTRWVKLVYPPDADVSAGKISVLTPVGAALIGLSAGQSIEYQPPSGERRSLTVLAVRAEA